MKSNRKKIFEKLLCGSLLAAGLCFCAGCGRTVKFASVNTAMGTMIYQTVYTSGEDVTDEITGLINELEQDTLSWRISGSEVARINAQAGSGEGISLSQKLSRQLAVLMEVSERSNGAFDMTLHPVVQLWNIDAWAAGESGEAAKTDVLTEPPARESSLTELPTWENVLTEPSARESSLTDISTQVNLPDPHRIEEALRHTGYEAVNIENGTLFLPEGMSLDLGAAGKGIACDEIAEFLRHPCICPIIRELI